MCPAPAVFASAAASSAGTDASRHIDALTPLCVLLFCVVSAPAAGPPSRDMIITVDTATDETIDPNMTTANCVI